MKFPKVAEQLTHPALCLHGLSSCCFFLTISVFTWSRKGGCGGARSLLRGEMLPLRSIGNIPHPECHGDVALNANTFEISCYSIDL